MERTQRTEVITREQNKAYRAVSENKRKLTLQEYRTLRGQIASGQPEAALKGLAKLLARKEKANGQTH